MLSTLPWTNKIQNGKRERPPVLTSTSFLCASWSMASRVTNQPYKTFSEIKHEGKCIFCSYHDTYHLLIRCRTPTSKSKPPQKNKKEEKHTHADTHTVTIPRLCSRPASRTHPTRKHDELYIIILAKEKGMGQCSF